MTARFADGDTSNNRGGSQHVRFGNAAGNLRAYVLTLPGNPAPGQVGSDGPYLK